MALRIDNFLGHRKLHVHVVIDRKVARDTPQPAVKAARFLVGGSLTADPVVGVEVVSRLGHDQGAVAHAVVTLQRAARCGESLVASQHTVTVLVKLNRFGAVDTTLE